MTEEEYKNLKVGDIIQMDSGRLYRVKDSVPEIDLDTVGRYKHEFKVIEKCQQLIPKKS
jgi:hypothetical protein